MRYVMQPWLIHLGSMARIKVDLWGRFLSPCVNFSFEKLRFPRREEGRVKLDNAKLDGFHKSGLWGTVGTVVVTLCWLCEAR